MNMDDILNTISPLPVHSLQKIKKYITKVDYPKGHILMHTGTVVPYIYFLQRGIVRAYASSEYGDITFWFGTEGEPIVSMKSYVENKPGYESIELLEHCTLYRLETAMLKNLYENDLSIANWGRKFAERELMKTEELIILRQYKTARDRYLDLLNEKPYLLQRVQLGYIASYLGITQVSLSRIRAEIK